MNYKASISLTALMSLIVGLLILFPLGLKAASYFGETTVDNSVEIPELVSTILTTPLFGEAKYSLRLYDRDLFLFYNKGFDEIRLKYIADGDYGDLIFERPEECEDNSCVCYCRSGPFWQETKEIPFLKPRGIIVGEPYSCPGMTCEVLSETLYFVNSRGTENYLKEITSKLIKNEKSDVGDKYTPISLDIITLLQQDLFTNLQTTSEKATNQHSAKLNPFFTSESGDKYSEYNIKYQDKKFIELLLKNYKWEGGYVLGGFGSSLSKKDRNNHELRQQPVSLKIESFADGIIGICIHETCLYDENFILAQFELSEHVKKVKIMEQFIQLPLLIKNSQVPDLLKIQIENSFLNIFEMAQETSLEPKITFSVNSEMENQIFETQNITLYFGDEIYKSFDIPMIISCSLKQTLSDISIGGIPESTFSLINYQENYLFGEIDGYFCRLSLKGSS